MRQPDRAISTTGWVVLFASALVCPSAIGPSVAEQSPGSVIMAAAPESNVTGASRPAARDARVPPMARRRPPAQHRPADVGGHKSSVEDPSASARGNSAKGAGAKPSKDAKVDGDARAGRSRREPPPGQQGLGGNAPAGLSCAKGLRYDAEELRCIETKAARTSASEARSKPAAGLKGLKETQ
jgi:hypothetical protein